VHPCAGFNHLQVDTLFFRLRYEPVFIFQENAWEAMREH